MKKIRLGVIGTGLAFRDLHLPVLMELHEQFEIVALFNRTESRAHDTATSIAEKSGYTPDVVSTMEDLLNRDDIEAVDIAVPINLTTNTATSALEKGKHVFAEKPIADNVKEGQALIELARSKGRVLAVGENFRFQRRFHQMRELVQSGLIGDAQVYRLNDMHYTYPDWKFPSTAWRKEGDFAGGYLIDGGVHTVAGMRSMVGSRVTAVHGLTAAFNPQLLSNQDDTLLLQLTFENGMIGQMALGYGAIDRDARKPKVYGREGTLTLFSDHIEHWLIGKDEPTQTIPVELNGDGFREEWLDFYNAVATGSPLISPPEYALVDLKIIMAGIESARSGQVVKLED
ncbi:MAG: Gfo/Idh/MocA family oxidoreductase [Chloroflexota bacterium]